jgi:regulator of protease activity HflC (stomatin/prohibitin superfamily)
METEKITRPRNGFFMFLLILVVTAASIVSFALIIPAAGVPLAILAFFLLFGFIVVNPNQSAVLTFFGKYVGTVKQNGFFWTNPFYVKKKISLRARNFDTDQLKVNDKMGNPILIGAVLVWQVEDTYKAAFNVNNYEEFVRIQTDSALRQLASSYSYDTFEDEHASITLRSSGDEISEMLEKQISERLHMAGLKVVEARISHLSYAPEIAHAMLQRQQATAIVSARQKIVEGAVGMVEMALRELSKKNIIELDDDKKAAMVSNLMVVLCGDKNAQPVVNTGTLYQ